MPCPESPSFTMGSKPDASARTTTAWGSYCMSSLYKKLKSLFWTKSRGQSAADRGSHEQLIGISRATYLQCHKRQQIREYHQRCAVEASWPFIKSSNEREEQDKAVKFAEIVEYITQTPVGDGETHNPFESCLETPATGEDKLGKELAQKELKALEITDEDDLNEIVNKIWSVLHPDEP
ncbi:uncharacterized protein ColSpa_07018 [Colletotrichum spaethianum]|uniref:Uncharacterized protein n=1 Tax=Colletotrichum spaethianum TaxID=700344 RepID=A0AA37NZ18_9PEZI|nr:uncharacterized protein ColSpa_07018 [Colletotrichum spaethianum]GKT46837.1 hypothetical protein ColSpa_07018 [Colletotrichum spaethianum]